MGEDRAGHGCGQPEGAEERIARHEEHDGSHDLDEAVTMRNHWPMPIWSKVWTIIGTPASLARRQPGMRA